MKQYDAIIIGFGKGGKDPGGRTGHTELNRCHHRAFGQVVRRHLHQYRVHTYEDIGTFG